MNPVDGLTMFLGFAILWITTVLAVGFWLIKKTIPTLLNDMKDSGMSDAEISKEMTNVAFPPRFHK
jgi:hypothetical protein